MGQALGLVVGVAGAAVGGFFGGPLGAQAGFLLGSILGNFLAPHKTPTPADIRVQDSAYGKFIPKVWGRYRLSGNVIWTGTPHSHDQSSGGKGGGGGKGGNQPYVTMSFAVALCKGEVDAILRIWANGKLIYDVSNPSNWRAISGSNSMVTGWTMYPGNETQTADPTMQSQLGAANVPAYRGLCYVVFNELNLQQWGNYLPSLSFEVVRDAAPSVVTTGVVSNFTSPGVRSPVSYISQIKSNGDCYGWQTGVNNAGSAFVARPFLLSATGLQWQGPLVNTGLADVPSDGVVSYDAPGIFIGGTWFNNSGTVEFSGYGPGLLLNQNARAMRRNGTIYYTTYYGAGAYPLYISPLLPFPHQDFAQSAQTFVMEVCAVTDNFVYCATWSSDPTAPNSIVKFDLQGNYLGVAISGKGGIGTRAYVVNDSLIYFSFANLGGGTVYRWDGVSAPVATALTFTMGGGAGNNFSVGANEGMVMVNNLYAGTVFYAAVVGYSGAQVSLQSIVNEICADAGLQPAQYTASTLTDTVVGYGNTGNASPRDMLSPLLATYFVDVSDSDGQLKFVRRGATPVSTIPWDDLGADASTNSDQAHNPIKETIQQEVELPAIETLSYISATTDYQNSSQREFYPGTTSNLNESVNVPVVLGDNDAKVRVQAMLWEKWSKRRSFEFSTGYKYLQLEPADTVNVQRQDGSLLPLRITKVALDGKGVMTFSADMTVPQIYPNPGSQTYVAQGSNSIGFRTQAIDYSGPTILVPMDLPPLRPQDANTPGLYLAAEGFDNTWPGCYVDMSRDDTNFTQLVTMSGASVIGQTLTALGSFTGGNIVDEINTVQVQLYNASQGLSSITYAALLNGGNAALIGGELVYFRTATQINTNTWQLSGLMRSRVATPQNAHAVGEVFVLLDPNLLGVANINLTDIGQPLYFETYLRNMFGNTPSGPLAITPSNARMAPIAPSGLTVTHTGLTGTGSNTDQLAFRWFRGARVNNAWYDGTDIPLDWAQESYQLSLINSLGALVARYVITSSGITRNGVAVPNTNISANQALPPYVSPATPAFWYTYAMMLQDGTSSAGTLYANLQQIGDAGVPGGVASATFNMS
ncbi:phage tail protein [Burkholderia cenocepacia]|uniref:phage tail protein n=1 Tax=Burkholderia cenocepacia TaxID=95486 RepID=UPI00264C02E3|nr:phage tail protein [Burkholderia cenocepacia]MDN7456604.1 phage tail protein [Burkholderia cenocepacia]